MAVRNFELMFRPAYEGGAAVSWGLSGVAVCVAQTPFWPALTVCTLAMALLRGRELSALYRFRFSISGFRVQQVPVANVVLTARSNWQKGALYLGKGFKWEQRHAETVNQIMARNANEIPAPPDWLPALVQKTFFEPPDFIPLKDTHIGVPWIHGLEPAEWDVPLPFDALPGHTLVVGTTRAGKTRFYQLLCLQIIERYKPLIIIDPKGDKDWEERVRADCERTGRKFLYFNPAFPSKSIRINPLANWHSASEPATRLGQLIDAEGTFAAFAWKTLYRIMRAMVEDGRMPTIRAAKDYVQKGVEPLLEGLLLKRFVDELGADWDRDLNSFKGDSGKGGKTPQVKSERLSCMIAKFEDRKWSDETIESLIAMVNHSKEHYSKMIQVLEPLLEMLGSSELGSMLSPDPFDMADKRPIYDMGKVISEKAVIYMSLGSLSNKIIASAIGSIVLADLAAAIGAIYNFNQVMDDVFLVVDESAEVINPQAIQILNKGGGAGVKAFFACQTVGDFDAVFGTNAVTRQALGNLNNVICFRVKDVEMAKLLSESFGKTVHRTLRTGISSNSGAVGAQMTEVEIPLVSQDVLTRLPGLQYFAFLAGSALWKGRLPVIT